MNYNIVLTLEGPDGAGKSSAIKALAARLEAADIPHMILREPGFLDWDQTGLSERLRSIMKEGAYSRDPYVTALMMQAARVEKWIAVEAILTEANDHGGSGVVILQDRNLLSTLAIQGSEIGLEAAEAITATGFSPERFPLLASALEVEVFMFGTPASQREAHEADGVASAYQQGKIEAAYRTLQKLRRRGYRASQLMVDRAWQQYRDATPEQIAAAILSHPDLSVLELEEPGVKTLRPEYPHLETRELD